MGTPYLAEIRVLSFNFAPKGWAMCNGQLLPINQNQALFALMGTTYGGNGQTDFALPNLQGRVPMHMGQGHSIGEVAGATSHTLLTSEMPPHLHQVNVSNSNATQGDPTGHLLAAANALYQAGAPNTSLAGTTVTTVGGSQPHTNQQPYLTLTFAVALQGIFPSHN